MFSFVASGFSVLFLGLGFRVQDRGFRVSVRGVIGRDFGCLLACLLGFGFKGFVFSDSGPLVLVSGLRWLTLLLISLWSCFKAPRLHTLGFIGFLTTTIAQYDPKGVPCGHSFSIPEVPKLS